MLCSMYIYVASVAVSHVRSPAHGQIAQLDHLQLHEHLTRDSGGAGSIPGMVRLHFLPSWYISNLILLGGSRALFSYGVTS